MSATKYQDVSVLIRGAAVFAGCAGHLFCLAIDSGDIVWHNELPGLGNNDIALALEGVSIQYLQKTETQG